MKQTVYEYDFELRRERSRRITTVTVTAVLIVLVLTAFLHFLLFPVLTRSDSMSPEIDRNSVIFVSPLVKTPSRGDIVYIDRLDGKKLSWWQNALDALTAFFTVQQVRPFANSSRVTGNNTLRRVVALPGDRITLTGGILFVTPKGGSHSLTEFELSEKKYNPKVPVSASDGWDFLGTNEELTDYVLGEDEYFVLSDDRACGTDSRLWGPIKSSQIKGRAVLEAFPFNRFSLL